MRPKDHHRHQKFSIHYPVSKWEIFYGIFLVPLIVLILAFFVYKSPTAAFETVPHFSLWFVVQAVIKTFVRLCIAYALAVIVAIPLALLANKNIVAERFILPLFDIVQSVPVLAFFPIIILFFIRFNLYSASAVFILFLSMLWNIVFSVAGGLRVVPADIKDAAHVFHVHGFQYTRRVLLPAIVPYLVTGSLLAWAQGWNIVIVAEVLHVYIPGGTQAQDLFGIGSLLVHATESGRHDLFFASVAVLIVAIALLNFFVWQKLLHYAEKFKFE